MRRAPRRIEQILAKKKDKIDWTTFNLIENLLVFRVLKSLKAPAESGVQFRISCPEGDTGICLLIKIDHTQDPIMPQGTPRPDYLAVYLYGERCICTIIEMKDRTEGELKHGVEQIETLAGVLKREFKTHLPGKLRIHVQGVLVTPPNSQLPLPRMAESEAKFGLAIAGLRFPNQHELFPYISQHIKVAVRYEHRPERNPRKLSTVETMMTNNALPERFSKREYRYDGSGIQIDYAIPNHTDSHATLHITGKKAEIVIPGRCIDFIAAVRAELAANGLDAKLMLNVEATVHP